MRQVIEDVPDEVQDALDEMPEALRALLRPLRPRPRCLFLAGNPAPHSRPVDSVFERLKP